MDTAQLIFTLLVRTVLTLFAFGCMLAFFLMMYIKNTYMITWAEITTDIRLTIREYLVAIRDALMGKTK